MSHRSPLLQRCNKSLVCYPRVKHVQTTADRTPASNCACSNSSRLRSTFDKVLFNTCLFEFSSQRRGILVACRTSDIIILVNDKHNTSWTASQVKTKIAYVKKKYREAVALNSTGEEPVLQRQEAICPLFLRLYTVFGGNSLSTKRLPPSTIRKQRRGFLRSDDSEDESTDLEAPSSDTDTTADGHYASEYPGKRQKKRRLTPVDLQRSVDKMLELANENTAALRAREQVVGNRERELSEKLLRLSDEANKRADEARVRLMQELAAERTELKKEVASERAEIREERAEIREERAVLRQEKEDFNRFKAEFMKQRDQLISENAALTTELTFPKHLPL
ncbi:hypothetical protein EC957_006920 [Mortierella hygrophila]|uniref:Uncharacterized protein n=1 Tax=Mortierella hygrophila TaxID=979708 RepID=A0A9P6EZ26_9FUNG|nr:hypothetical protein EC957_006920 [Mortierella hygrophila]